MSWNYPACGLLRVDSFGATLNGGTKGKGNQHQVLDSPQLTPLKMMEQRILMLPLNFWTHYSILESNISHCDSINHTQATTMFDQQDWSSTNWPIIAAQQISLKWTLSRAVPRYPLHEYHKQERRHGAPLLNPNINVKECDPNFKWLQVFWTELAFPRLFNHHLESENLIQSSLPRTESTLLNF